MAEIRFMVVADAETFDSQIKGGDGVLSTSGNVSAEDLLRTNRLVQSLKDVLVKRVLAGRHSDRKTHHTLEDTREVL